MPASCGGSEIKVSRSRVFDDVWCLLWVWMLLTFCCLFTRHSGRYSFLPLTFCLFLTHTHTHSPQHHYPPQKIGKLRFTFFRLSDSTLFADIFLITSWFPPHPPPYVLSFDELRGSGRSSCSAAQRSAGSLKVCIGSWKLCRIFTLEMSVNELISCLYAHWFQRCDWSDCFCFTNIKLAICWLKPLSFIIICVWCFGLIWLINLQLIRPFLQQEIKPWLFTSRDPKNLTWGLLIRLTDDMPEAPIASIKHGLSEKNYDFCSGTHVCCMF